MLIVQTLLLAALAQAQAAPAPHIDDNRPPVAFRENWTDPTEGTPTDYHVKELDNHLQNKNMEHGRYGLGAKDVQYVRQLNPKTGPGYIWLGACADGPCLITLKDKSDYIDLATNPLSKVVWRTKQGGFRQLRLVLKLADGSFIISDKFAGPAEDWNVQEMSIRDIRWRRLIIRDPRMYEDAWVEKPDLTKVDEIGFTDLMIGGPGFTSGTSRVDWIEVHGLRVKRPGATNND